jgi:tetratricopeptide (TPR) repeat protein
VAKRKKERAAEPEPAAAPRHLSRPLFAVLGAALVVKLAVFFAFHDHPLLQADTGLDAGTYVHLASRVVAGDILLGKEPFFVSPLYVYFLAPIFALTGGSLAAARFVQILLGTAAAGLLFGAARKFVGERAALAGAALYILTGVVTFHEVLILQAALDPFLTALFLFLLARALAARELSLKVNGAFAWAGCSLGLLALNRPNVLLCAAAIAFLLSVPLFSFEEWSLRTFGCAAAFVAGVVLAIAPATLRNLAVSREPVLISSHGGLNLFIGNGPSADGTYSAVPGITPSIDGQAEDAKKVAEAEEGRPLSTREVSAHFTRLAFSWVRTHPGAAARLFVKKLGLLANRIEVPLNLSYAWYASGPLSPLSFLVVGPWLLVPLGILGLVWRLFETPRGAFAVWAAFAPVYALSVALFFVSSRYRLPLLLPLACGAGFAFDALAKAARARDGKRLGLAAAALFPLAFLAFRETGIDDGRANEETEYIIWQILAGQDAAAKERLARLTPRHPLPGVLWFRSGRAWMEAGRPESAITAFRKALDIDRDQPETLLALSQACVASGDLPAALAALRAVPEGTAGGDAGGIPEAEALALIDGGREAEALPFLLEACRVSPGRASAHQNAATLLGRAGRMAEARAHAAEALRLNPSYDKARALLDALGGKPPSK